MRRVLAAGIALSMVAAFLLAASCGGSSSSSVDPGGGEISNWNELTWNQDHWGP